VINSIGGLSDNIFNVYPKLYFVEGKIITSFLLYLFELLTVLLAYHPVCKGDTFPVHGGMRTVKFKVIETDPSKFCIVAHDTLVHPTN